MKWLLMGILVGILLLGGVSACDYYLDTCKDSGWVVGSTYCLNQSINVDTDVCLRNLNEVNVTIDGQGFSIIKTANIYTGIGIQIGGNKNVTIRNFGNISLFKTGVSSGAQGKVYNNTISFCKNALSLTGSLINVSNNNLYFNHIGVYISNVDSNLLEYNVFNLSKDYPILLYNSNNNTLDNNVFYRGYHPYNKEYWSNISSYTFTNNSFTHFTNNSFMHSMVLSQDSYSPGDLVEFNLSLKNAFDDPCSSCTYFLEIYPSEIVSYSQNSDLVSGNFSVSQSGIHSIYFTINDSFGNSYIGKESFLVNASGQKSQMYFFRGSFPNSGAIASSLLDSSLVDVGYLSKTYPSEPETRSCGIWVQYFIEDLPDYPYSLLNMINYSIWYNVSTLDSPEPEFGYEMRGTYTTDFDDSASTERNYLIIVDSVGFGSLSFRNSYIREWYWRNLKMLGGFIYTYSGEGYNSNATIIYNYTETPAVKSISNDFVEVLSATMENVSSKNAIVLLEGEGETRIVLEMPDEGSGYLITYDGVLCSTNGSTNCVINSQINGVINLTLLM